MMQGVTAEQIAGWGQALDELTASIGDLFSRPEPRVVFAQFIEGLLAEVPRKNGWTLAERAGHVRPDRMQWLLGGAVWDAEELRGRVRDYVVTHLGDPQATLVLDDTQAQKKGTQSVGVAYQHCGVTGDVRNCQVMVMLTYASAVGHAFVDRRLYLPESWTADRERCRAAGVPDGVGFATKAELGRQMLECALAEQVPFGWVAADADYGKDPKLRSFCHDNRLPYALAVPVCLPLSGPPGKPRQPKVACAGDLLHYATGRAQWERHSQGEGSKGQRFYDWTCFEVRVTGQAPADGFAHHLLIRRSTEKKQLAGGHIDYEYAYFLIHAPTATPTSEMISRSGVRWQTEEDNQQNKQVVGLDQYQVRKWTPWHRHVTSCMLAHAFLAVQRAQHDNHGDTDAATANDDPQTEDQGKALATQDRSPTG
jgi:SRSO17 transposase